MNKKKTALLVMVAILIGLFYSFDLGGYLTLESLKTHRNALISFAARHRAGAMAAFLSIYIIQTALSLPGAAILSLSAGLIFGVAAGTLLAVIGATIGAVLAFAVARYLFHDWVEARLGDRLARLNRALEQEGFNYLLFLRLVPIFPFFLINLGAALTRLPLRTFFLATVIGIIPGGFVYVNAGASLATISRVSDIVSFRVLGSFALLGMFALVPVVYRRLRNRGSRE